MLKPVPKMLILLTFTVFNDEFVQVTALWDLYRLDYSRVCWDEIQIDFLTFYIESQEGHVLMKGADRSYGVDDFACQCQVDCLFPILAVKIV